MAASTHRPAVIVGMGEMGGVFARGFLRAGYPVYPAMRGDSLNDTAAAIPQPECVLIAVGEAQLQDVLAEIPASWREQVCLLQNELLPRDWQAHGLQPTVISVWFEKKMGQDVKVLLPSPVYGNNSAMLCDALSRIRIPTVVLPDAETLTYQLVLKNLYILSTNIAGIITQSDVADLVARHLPLARDITQEILQIQQYLCGTRFDFDVLWPDLLKAYDSDPAHGCMGRSAPQRLKRALGFADAAGLAVPIMRSISQRLT